ncbi:MAG: tetratricopeptide repeat protein [Proteobacteria bacterium]|nr:tetratricopeptide repeat protein [Desulfobacula sp.]MBU3950777.1 tetratricopeptide repeat protein [Pseudomonadota bacterium]MBU4133027.1 tetratricopeptide repeat protein [Pseudomonadota bacterium]
MQERSILVVSEKERERTALTQILKKIGYDQILSAQSGGNAWAFLKSKKIDCVISAYEMEEMSGLALLKILRREEPVADLPFFLTHDAFTKIKVIKAGQIGVTGLFVIPYNGEGMKDKLFRALEKIKDPVIAQVEESLEKGVDLIERQEFTEALKVFQTLVNQRENPEYYFNIGYIKTSQGQHSEAIEAFSKATQLDRLFVKAYEAMGRAYKALGDAQKSEECLQVAAEIYMDTDKLGSAEELLNEILEAGSNSLNVFNTLGVLHRKKGDINQALRQYKKALKVHPDEPYIYYNIGRLYLDMKNTTQAKLYFQAALDKDHGFEEAKQVIKAIDLGLV